MKAKGTDLMHGLSFDSYIQTFYYWINDFAKSPSLKFIRLFTESYGYINS